MSYWDSSALVKLYVKEADSAQFEALALAEPLVTGTLALHEVRTVFRRRGERHRALRELHRRADHRRRGVGFFRKNERLSRVKWPLSCPSLDFSIASLLVFIKLLIKNTCRKDALIMVIQNLSINFRR